MQKYINSKALLQIYSKKEMEQNIEELSEWTKREAYWRFKIAVSYKEKKDTFQSMLSFHLLSQLMNSKKIKFSYIKNNKPILLNHDVKFSMAHTQGISCACISNYEVGIDTVLFNEVDNFFLSLVCNEYELKQISTNIEIGALFFAAKEAISKMLNEDLYSSPKTNLSLGETLYDKKNPSVIFSYYFTDKGVIVSASYEEIEFQIGGFLNNLNRKGIIK